MVCRFPGSIGILPVVHFGFAESPADPQLNSVFFSLQVAPRAGAWVEIGRTSLMTATLEVAPRAGAWVEITIANVNRDPKKRSLLVQERGLKW